MAFTHDTDSSENDEFQYLYLTEIDDTTRTSLVLSYVAKRPGLLSARLYPNEKLSLLSHITVRPGGSIICSPSVMSQAVQFNHVYGRDVFADFLWVCHHLKQHGLDIGKVTIFGNEYTFNPEFYISKSQRLADRTYVRCKTAKGNLLAIYASILACIRVHALNDAQILICMERCSEMSFMDSPSGSPTLWSIINSIAVLHSIPIGNNGIPVDCGPILRDLFSWFCGEPPSQAVAQPNFDALRNIDYEQSQMNDGHKPNYPPFPAIERFQRVPWCANHSGQGCGCLSNLVHWTSLHGVCQLPLTDWPCIVVNVDHIQATNILADLQTPHLSLPGAPLETARAISIRDNFSFILY